jgi:dynein heavy chain
LFNLRDISRIYQGIVSADKKQVTKPVELLRLWIHENMRVFGDRLIEVKERKWMEDQLFERAKNKFALTHEEVFNSDRLIFGDFYEGIDMD